MTSVVACVYKHPVKNQTCLPILLSGFLLLPRPCFMALFRNKTNRKEKKSQGLKQGLKKDGKAKTFQKKRHLPETPSPEESYSPIKVSVTESLPPMTRRNSATSTKPAEFKRDEELQHIELCNFCYMFHQFSRFFQHISLIWYIWSIFTSGLIYFYLNKSGKKKNCRRGFLLNAKHKQPFFSTSKRAKSCMIFSCAAGHHRFEFQDSGTREKNHKLLQSRHILNLQKILRTWWCTSTFKWPNDTSISLRRLGSRHDLTDQGPSHAAAAPAWF